MSYSQVSGIAILTSQISMSISKITEIIGLGPSRPQHHTQTQQYKTLITRETYS